MQTHPARAPATEADRPRSRQRGARGGALVATLEELLRASAARHAHLCPRQVLGVRMGMLAAELLGLELPRSDKRLLAIVETDGCFVDGVSSATGCQVGHRTLRIVDYGKIAATFVDTHHDRAFRIAPHPTARAAARDYAPEARDRWEAYLLGYQRMPVPRLLVWQPVRLREPSARLLSRPEARAICARCQEEVYNEREVIQNGIILCQACAGTAYYESTDA
ncbi:MAG: formylmethanofuran dehydrogenase [Chloroflexi bacterium]|nr:formylmethanofuran dehydrogenase [Chloroflexota bacterium]